MVAVKKFDIFISYKSEDEDCAQRVKRSLQQRGVIVWLDKDEIRPGDRFITALESGLESSRSVALLATPSSLASGWVVDEYHRALTLSQAGQLRLIPVLVRDATLPGFLSSRQYVDLRQEASFEHGIDRLVWPGVTEKRALWQPVSGLAFSSRWQQFRTAARAEGIDVAEGEDLYRSEWLIQSNLKNESQRLVVVVDPFEERPAERAAPRNRVVDYIDSMMRLREATKGQANEIIFALYIQSDAWKRVQEVRDVSASIASRLKHYFVIHQDDQNECALRQGIREVWNRVQRDLMIQERNGRAA